MIKDLKYTNFRCFMCISGILSQLSETKQPEGTKWIGNKEP